MWYGCYPKEEHEVRLAIGDPAALAFMWIKAYAANLSNQENTITEDELIQYGVDWAESTSQWGGDYLVRGGTLEGTGTDPLFWDKLAEFTGKEIPEDKRENFFSCSC